MTKKYLPTRTSQAKSVLLIGLFIFLYIIDNSLIASLIGSSGYNLVIKPLLFGGLALIIWLMPAIHPRATRKQRQSINVWAFNFAIVYIVILILAGLIDGLGQSPYDHSITGIIINVFVVGSILLGKELLRGYVVNSLSKDENYFIFVLVALIMTITSISLKRFTEISEYVDIVKFLAKNFAPEFSKNIFATYLAYLGGPISSLIYVGLLQAFHWLSPVLPDLKWITTALIGILCPIFSLTFMQTIFYTETKALKKSERNEESPLGWIITCLAAIGIIWFSVGVFSIYPSVIATGSMEPLIKPGDVILVEKVKNMEDINNLQVGDVIQFRSDDNILISHRIMDLVEEDKLVSFRTKGDNNSGSDIDLVKPEQIKGKIIKVVPKVGWPTLLLKSRKEIPLEKIVF